MSDYNSEYIYNASGDERGTFYNIDTYITLINLKETLNVSLETSKITANYILQDKPTQMYDTLLQTAVYGVVDTALFDDYARYSALFSVTDELGITTELSSLLVLAYINEKQNIIDNVKQLNYFLSNDTIKFTDGMSLKTLMKLLDTFEMKELKTYLEYILSLYEREGIADSVPRSAVSDFFIGATEGFDNSYDWLIPFDVKIDWNSTSIQVMPEASNTLIEMPGIDGSIVEDTVYNDRLFQIVAFSEDGLSNAEKEELKSKITEILDSTKHTTKKLTIEASGNSFDVKYDGQAVIDEGPSYVKATIPFRTSPYGYKAFEGELYGSGLVYNDGDASIGVRHIISGPISIPTFKLGDIDYRWGGSISSGCSLVIDHQMMTCYLQDPFGGKTNALAWLTGSFQKIPAHTSVVLTATGNLNNHIYTTWRDKVLW